MSKFIQKYKSRVRNLSSFDISAYREDCLTFLCNAPAIVFNNKEYIFIDANHDFEYFKDGYSKLKDYLRHFRKNIKSNVLVFYNGGFWFTLE